MGYGDQHDFDSLVVRLVMPEEVARFNELLDAHHYLGTTSSSASFATLQKRTASGSLSSASALPR